MGKTILVTGKEGFLGNEISQHFLNQDCRVVASVPPRKDTFPKLDPEGKLLQVPWNRRSPVAAKNFLLQAIQHFDSLDEAWLVITPEREAFVLAELAPLALDEGIDGVLKGTLYLVRELLQYQATHPSLVLHFVFYDEEPAALPPLAAVEYQGLKGLVSSLLLQSRKRHLPVWAYEALVPRTEEYLRYLLSGKTNEPGRWNLFGEKKTLMNTLFNRKELP